MLKWEEPEQMFHSYLSGHDVAVRTKLFQKDLGSLEASLVSDDITF